MFRNTQSDPVTRHIRGLSGPMGGSAQPCPVGQNRLLHLVPQVELSRLHTISKQISIRPRQVLHHWKLPLEHVYFIQNGLVSVAAKVGTEKFVEAWLIGSEGMVGAPLIMARTNELLHRRVVRVGGSAIQIPMSDFRAALNELPVLHAILYRYVGVVLMQTSQSGACNSAHRLKQRLARWLLLARSGLQRNELPLTHLTLAGLLGVRRASVTECLEILQRERVIETSRNLIVIKHPELLKSLCCDCFRLMEREYERSVGQGL